MVNEYENQTNELKTYLKILKVRKDSAIYHLGQELIKTNLKDPEVAKAKKEQYHKEVQKIKTDYHNEKQVTKEKLILIKQSSDRHALKLKIQQTKGEIKEIISDVKNNYQTYYKEILLNLLNQKKIKFNPWKH